MGEPSAVNTILPGSVSQPVARFTVWPLISSVTTGPSATIR